MQWPVDWNGKVVVVTGASSGIGHATALLAAERGATVVGIARREDRLQALERLCTERAGEDAAYDPSGTDAEDSSETESDTDGAAQGDGSDGGHDAGSESGSQGGY